MKSRGKSAHELANDPKLSNLTGDIEVAPAPRSEEQVQTDLDSVKRRLQASSAPEEKPREAASSSRV